MLCVQLRHSKLEGPVQVPHEASQARQTLLAFVYFPAVVHEARQLPGGSKNGVDDAHCVHSDAVGPEQRLQLPWQGKQVSRASDVPPEHVKPSSIVLQSALQPSVSIVLPSSHASTPT